MSVPTILVVEDRDSLRRVWVRALGEGGYRTLSAATVAEGMEVLERESVDLVLTDLRLPDGEGTAIVEAARRVSATIPIVMMTAFGSVQNAVEAMKLGATDFLEKPVDLDALGRRIEQWLSPGAGSEAAGQRVLRDGLTIVGQHPRLLAALRLVDRVAPMESTVLLLGESGTGKELFARAIHEASARSEKPFVPVNCAALPESLIENELFGHERGAFTGADRRQEGRFHAASGGTLFLDEIGELPLAVQGKVLRVLEERTYERVGGGDTLRADIRLVAATNRDLEEMVAEGAFRADLFYRLEVFPIELPPLRRRRSDVPLLARALLERAAGRNALPCPRLEPDAAELLAEHDWPGNIRQLANLLERALILHAGGSMGTAEIAELLRPDADGGEERDLRRALAESDGDRQAAARALGISVRTLQRRIRQYDLAGFPRYGD